MPVKLVLGLQHGDEGKGRVVDDLTQTWSDVIVRFQGGGNAGHTVYDEEGNKNGTYTSFKSYASALDISKYKSIDEWKMPTIAHLEDIINWTENTLTKDEHKKTKMLLVKSCNDKINQITSTE